MVVVLCIFSKEKKSEYIILLDRLNELNMKFMTVCLLKAAQRVV